MTDRSTSPQTAGQSWEEHYLCTIAEQSVRIAVALERIVELADKASSADDAELERREARRQKLRAKREAGIHDHDSG